MRIQTFALLLSVTICSFEAEAILVDNGGFTSDTESSLDWLDLSITSGLPYNAAGAAYPNWRFATNAEVEDLFGKAFEGFYSTISSPWFGLSRSEDGTYADQLEDVLNFKSMFGITHIQSGNNTQQFSYGLYTDENGDLKFMGAVHDPANPSFAGGRTVVYGPDYTGNEFPDFDQGYVFAGTYLVRATRVPESGATAILMGIAFSGLLFLRKRMVRANTF